MTADQQEEQQPGQEEAGRIEGLDERFGKIEAEQAQQRGMLEQIRDSVAGKGDAGPAHDKAQAHTEHRLEHPPAQTIADQVRRAVKEVGAEEEQKRRDAEHADHHQKLREAAEQPPREPAAGVRGRIQRAMFGKAD